MGCDRDPLVRVYEAPKDPPIARATPPRMAAKVEGPTRFLIAIIPIKDQVYFVKAQERPPKLDELSDGMRQIASKAKLGEDGKIDWALPNSWTEKPGTGIASANFEVATDADPITLTVTPLAGPSGDATWESYLETNVNRWRRQLSLPEVSYAEQKDSLTEIRREGSKDLAWIFDLQTEDQESAESAAPEKTTNTPPASPEDSFALKFDTPEGWVAGATNQFRMAAFAVKEGDEKAEVTVSNAGGDQLSNVVRWQREVCTELSKEKIDALAKEAIEEALNVKTSHGVEGTLYSVSGPEGESQEVILAAILPLADNKSSLFVKLKGPAKVADAHRERLMQFISSMKW
jgi:hypothetical protein